MTEGPCYDAKSEVIQDISYGYTGLPMRMYFQVLDESCNPVSGATIDVWHVSPVGKYSGDDSANEDVAYCTGSDPDFTSHLYFRGRQTTDATGVLFFDTCFPGWYSSRTVHIHLTVSVGGQSYVTTQLFFPDALDDEIIDTQPVYDARGARDTTNETDTVITAEALPDYLFQTEKMTDGAMLAWKTIVLRSSLSEASCAVQGSGGMGGPGGPPGDGGFPPGDGGVPPAPPDGG
jgi:protocatechuate 3,4-dioxygenase beta subunit